MTTQNVRDRVANIFFLSIIIAGLFMSYGAYYSQPVQAQHPDTNLISNKPAPYRRLNSNGYSQKYIELSGTNRVERMHQLLAAYGHDNYEVWQTIARVYKIYPEVLICIAYSETSLGKFTKSARNVSNVGNNDRGDTIAYDNIESGINAMGKTLNNKYLGHKKRIGDLYPFHKETKCEVDCGYAYATSKENSRNNVANCLGMIRNKEVTPDFYFRW